MDGPTFQNKPNIVTTMVAWRERLAINTSDFMFVVVFWIVNYAIDAGAWAFLPRFEYVASSGISHKLRNSLSEGRPTLYHRGITARRG